MKLQIDKLSRLFRKPQISPYYFELLDQILVLENKTKNLTDAEIKLKVKKLKESFNSSISEQLVIAESFSLTREISTRKLGLKHFETQILGGLILNDGKIAEMKTGEGKTLVATLPACFQALSNKGVHIITVNEYLAKRDKELLQVIYQGLGFRVGLIRENMEIGERQYNYACDITYGTNTEFGFDYLRDLMSDSRKNRVLRAFNYCLIDEVDSVLIDEAQTPLILSTAKPVSSDRYPKALWVAKQLVPNRHFIPKYRTKQTSLTEEGYNFLTEIFQTDDLYDPKNPWLGFIENSLRALLFYQKDQDYIIYNDQIQIIDKFTGRVSKDRKWSDGLHQAIECKENVEVTSETLTLNSITYPKFFSLYKKVSGMTGTAKTSQTEFKEFYGLEVISVPTRKTIQRKDFPDEIFETKKAKFRALIDQITIANKLGRPVLVGTTTIEDSEILVETLNEFGLNDVQLLNAKPKNSESEAETISQSGILNALTIATNMAGRGTDIILGGNLKYIVNDLTKQLIYDLVDSNPRNIKFAGNFGKLNLIIKDILRILEDFHPALIRYYLDDVSDIGSHTPQTPLDFRLQQLYNMILEECYEDWEKGKQLVCNLGGLLILGTSRHESRRIDNQLRGRAGRQGDQGESMFFLSLEDDLVKRYDPNLFLPFLGRNSLDPFSGTDYIAVSKSFDNLQLRVEKYLYENRKSTASYEEVYLYHQRLFFMFRECILEYSDPLNLIVNLCSYNFLYPLSSNFKIPLYQIALQKQNKRDQAYSFIYLAALLSSSITINANNYSVNYLNFSKYLVLQVMDDKWTEFGERISLSRDTIGLQAYAQKDPLIQYGRLCTKEFSELIAEIQFLIINSFINTLEINKIYLGA